jgi:CspA family cold shock protein
MAIGTVKFFNVAKGFGFIIPEDGGKDVFFHKSSVELAGINKVTQGQRLSFETVQDAKGAMKASELKPHSAETVSGPAPAKALESSLKGNSTLGSTGKKPHRGTSFKPHAAIVPADAHGSHRDPKAHNMTNEWQRNYDRYCDLAKNAGEDGVARQNYWQHAEHFLRMLNGSAN